MTFDPRTWVDEELVTADIMNEAVRDHLNLLPRGVLAYAERATTLDVTAGVQALSVDPVIAAGRRIKITVRVIVLASVALDAFIFRIRNTATALHESGIYPVPYGAGTSAWTVIGQHTETPAAGARNYNLFAQRILGSGTISLVGTAAQQTSILVEDIGPA